MLDTINSSFPFISTLFIWNSILVLAREKQPQGISFLTAIFFLLWSFWMLYYYSVNWQPVSLLGSTSMMLANLAWAITLGYFKVKAYLERFRWSS